MEILYPIIPLMVVIIVLLFKKLNIKNIINGLFWGILSAILSLIIGDIVTLIFKIPTDQINLGLFNQNLSIFSFIVFFFAAGLPEELSKFICIKCSNSKNKSSIFINAVLIGLTFGCVENYLYISEHGNSVGLMRTLYGAHLIFQLIMAFFLIKAQNKDGNKKILYTIMAIIIPILCHTIYDTVNESLDILSYIFKGLGILSYIIAFYYLIKLPIENEETKIRFFILKIVLVILCILFLTFSTQNNHSNNLNENCIIQQDNIELKVISSEKTEIRDSNFPVFDGNYIKVKVQIKNNNDTTFIPYDFYIVDNLNENDSTLANVYTDDILGSVDANETLTGYLYFEDKGYDYSYLKYTAGEIGARESYSFAIK